MGFASGVLSDLQRRWETQRAQEAEAAKEQRLAAIRAVERSEDRQFTREQFTAQQTAMDKRDERNFGQQKELYELQDRKAAARDERNFAQQRQLAAEGRAASAAEAAAGRAHSEKLAGMRTPAERAPRIESYINEKTGKVLQFNISDPDDVSRLKVWQQTQPVRPYNPPTALDPTDPLTTPAAGARAPAPASLGYNPKTGRLEPAVR